LARHSGCTLFWWTPDVFDGHYTEKADVFSPGVLFYAILAWDFIEVDGKKFYGAFRSIPGVGKVALGNAMATCGTNVKIQFSPQVQGSNALERIALNAMNYDKHDRWSADEIHDRVTNVQLSVRLEFGRVHHPCCLIGNLIRRF